MTLQRKTLIAALLCFPVLNGVCADGIRHFDPDTDQDRVEWYRLIETLGRAPDVRGRRFGAVIKTQTNEYWRLVASGYRRRAVLDGVKLDVQAAQSESDPTLQVSIMETMIGSRYSGILISPQSDSNLQTAIDDAGAAAIPLLNVDGAVADSVRHFVGPLNGKMGERVGAWFVEHFPGGGKVAIIEGQAGVFSTVRRSEGFRKAISESGRFRIVASVSGDWDRSKSSEEATAVMRDHPDLLGFYCNNDNMALGVVDAAAALHRLDRVRIFGSDGTTEAYASIKAGRLTGTVDIFPVLIGDISLGIAERLAVGQHVPRVIATPQALITRDNVTSFPAGDEALRATLRDNEVHRR